MSSWASIAAQKKDAPVAKPTMDTSRERVIAAVSEEQQAQQQQPQAQAQPQQQDVLVQQRMDRYTATKSEAQSAPAATASSYTATKSEDVPVPAQSAAPSQSDAGAASSSSSSGVQQKQSSSELSLQRAQVALVVDTGGLIRGTNLLQQAEEFWTVPEVIDEVRDQKTKAFVESFPFELRLKEPHPDSLAAVVEFAKLTGDFASLSLTDLKLIALTRTLEVEYEGEKYLRAAPPPVRAVDTRKGNKQIGETSTLFFATAASIDTHTKPKEASKPKSAAATDAPASLPGWDDSDGGWITRENIADVTAALSGQFRASAAEARERKVGCMTTDYSMQNVLLQMGLHLVTVEGMHIRQMKQWVLRCYGCNTITRDAERKFCHNCGHPTLQRVAMHVNADGDVVLEHNPRKQISTRGSRFSIPKPKGGRQNNDLVLREEQYLKKTQFRSKASKYGFAPDAVHGAKAGHADDVEVGYGKRNPNVSRKRHGKKNRTTMGVA